MKRLALLLLLSPAACFASRTLTDELGRTVAVPDHPHKLVCLAPSIVDDVYSMGAGNDVIAVSEYTTYPAEAAQKPTIGAPLNPSLEKIIALHPDLVLGRDTAITEGSAYRCSWRSDWLSFSAAPGMGIICHHMQPKLRSP